MMKKISWLPVSIKIITALVVALSTCSNPVIPNIEVHAFPIIPPAVIFTVSGASPLSDLPGGGGWYLVNGVCPDPGSPIGPVCTLREAVDEANASGAGLAPPAYALVNFSGAFPIDIYYGPIIILSNVVIAGLPTNGPLVMISPAPPLPPLPPGSFIAPPYTQFQMAGNNSEIYGLILNGPGTSTDSIHISGNQNLVDANIIMNSNGSGVHISGPTPNNGTGNQVAQNWIGIDNLDNCGANQYGVHLDGGAFNNTINLNWISCNTQHGIYIDSMASHPTIPPVSTTIIDSNLIGTDNAGAVAKPNQLSGIYDDEGFTTVIKTNQISGNTVDGITLNETTATQITTNNLIGTDAPGLLALPNGAHGINLMDFTNAVTISMNNVISGNTGDGIHMDGSMNMSNTVIKNFIGVDVSGTLALGNGGDGIELNQADGNTIGGLDPSTGRNIISGNTGNGINIKNADSTLIYSNYIGLDVNGTLDLGNGGDGIHIDGPTSAYNTISPILTSDPLPEQFISCNGGDGIEIDYSFGNIVGPTTYIGVKADKATSCGNDGAGVYLHDNADDNEIHAQVIAFNGVSASLPGILIVDDTSTGNQILPVPVSSTRRMDIYDNGGLPIDLGNDGHTPNDSGDTDSGPNTLLNFPVITGYTATTVSGTMCNNCEVHIYQAFGNPAANGGGGVFLLKVVFTGTNWTATIPTGYSMGDLSFVAYDPVTEDTSEMSPRFQMFMPLVITP